MKTTTTALIVLAAWIAVLMPQAGCDSDGDDATDADADTDTDADADTDSDTDTDADTDTDTDTDGDTDTELDCEGGRLDTATGLCWEHPVTQQEGYAATAIAYCDNSDLAGHDDWFLPSREDFMTLLGGCDDDVLNGNYGYCNSCENSEACNAAFGADQELYRTSTLTDSSMPWVVRLHDGYIATGTDNYQAHPVRCVRSTL